VTHDLTPFSNRLQKNLKHWGKWARRRGITCYRLYDRDIPEFPFAIDRYENHLHVQEFLPQQHSAEEPSWQPMVTPLLTELCAIPAQQIHFKTRQRQRGSQQYQRQSENENENESNHELIVEEGGLRFLINLHSYLDSGLFLDHRTTRQMVRQRASGKRFLNLFAYTGSFTVYAAAGGAKSSVTVDLSNTYQQWSRRNLELNGLASDRHQRQRADVFRYLSDARQAGERFDLIVIDPPSFSNSKKMTQTLDIQRDHRRLLEAALQLLTPGGEIFFSTNRKGFRLDPELVAEHPSHEITHQTVPEDFQRHRPHRCWKIER